MDQTVCYGSDEEGNNSDITFAESTDKENDNVNNPVQNAIAQQPHGYIHQGPSQQGPMQQGPSQQGSSQQGPSQQGSSQQGSIQQGPNEKPYKI